jgi:hypothetical protein
MTAVAFHASAAIALIAGLAAVLVRRGDRALGGFAVAFAALLVPLIQLQAAAVAGVMLLAAASTVVLLGVVTRTNASGSGQRLPLAYWLPAGIGLLGFVWVVLATGSRQVVDHGDPLPRASKFGDQSALLLELGTEFVVPALLVALLALCAVIAAVLGLVGKEA